MCYVVTVEAEYVALGEGVKEAFVTDAVLSYIFPELSGARVRVFEDNHCRLFVQS